MSDRPIPLRPLLRYCGWPVADLPEVAERLDIPLDALTRVVREGGDYATCSAYARRAGATFDQVWHPKGDPGKDEVTFSTRAACDIARVSYRQADYWVRIFALAPTYDAHGSGSRRHWTPGDVQRLATMGRIMSVLSDALLVGACIERAWDANDGEAPTEVVVEDPSFAAGVRLVAAVPSFAELAEAERLRRSITLSNHPAEEAHA